VAFLTLFNRRGGAWSPPADLLGYNRLAGMAGRIRPALVGSPAVNVRGTVATAEGRLGPCASFDGTNALSVGMYPSFDPARSGGDWTLSVDFRMTALPSVGSATCLLAAWRSDIPVNQFRFMICAGTGPVYYPQIDFRIAGNADRMIRIFPVASNVAVDTWYTMALRYQSSDSSYTIDWDGQTSSVVRDINTGNATTTGAMYYDAAVAQTNAVVLGGLWDANNGWTSTLTGRLENLRFHSRRLSDGEITTLSAGEDPSSPSAATEILLSEPQAYQVHQRNGSNQATLRISGCLRGAAQTLTDVEFSWNGGAWTALSATVDNTARTFTGTATISPTAATPAGRQGTLQVRLANATGVTASVTYVGIGDVWAIWGQSNSTGAYTAPQPYSASNGLKGAFQRADGEILELDESANNSTGHGHDYWAWGGTESAGEGSHWPRFAALWADRTGYPVMIVNCGIAGASINATSGGLQGWSPSASVGRARLLGGYASLRDRVLSLSGGVKAVIGHEGETDASAAMAAATYQGHLETLANQIATDLSAVKTVSALLPTGLSGAAAINTGIADAAGANANCLVGPDLAGVPYDASPHWTTDANAVTVAAAWDARLAVLGY